MELWNLPLGDFAPVHDACSGSGDPKRARSERPSTCLQPLETIEIIRNPAVQIVLRGVTELGARARNIVDAGSGIGHAEEIQPGSDLDVGARQMLTDDARDIVERDADTGADIVDAAL